MIDLGSELSVLHRECLLFSALLGKAFILTCYFFEEIFVFLGHSFLTLNLTCQSLFLVFILGTEIDIFVYYSLFFSFGFHVHLFLSV